MTITPKNDVTINGITYKAETTYNVTYTIYTRMVVSGAMKTHDFVETKTTDVLTNEQIEETKPVRKPRRRTTKKTK